MTTKPVTTIIDEQVRECGKAAPAQDEREAFEALYPPPSTVYFDSQWGYLWDGERDPHQTLWEVWQQARATHPAQTEQKPVAHVTGAGYSGIDTANPKTEWMEISVLSMPLQGKIPLGAKLYLPPVAQTELVEATAIEQAKQQITGFVCGLRYDARELVQSMGLSLEEWRQIKAECNWIPASVAADFDAALAAQGGE